MSTKFHIGENGPAPCHARPGKCPINRDGSEHFDSMDEATERYEQKIAERHNGQNGTTSENLADQNKFRVLSEIKSDQAFLNPGEFADKNDEISYMDTTAKLRSDVDTESLTNREVLESGVLENSAEFDYHFPLVHSDMPRFAETKYEKVENGYILTSEKDKRTFRYYQDGINGAMVVCDHSDPKNPGLEVAKFEIKDYEDFGPSPTILESTDRHGRKTIWGGFGVVHSKRDPEGYTTEYGGDFDGNISTRVTTRKGPDGLPSGWQEKVVTSKDVSYRKTERTLKTHGVESFRGEDGKGRFGYTSVRTVENRGKPTVETKVCAPASTMIMKVNTVDGKVSSLPDDHSIGGDGAIVVTGNKHLSNSVLEMEGTEVRSLRITPINGGGSRKVDFPQGSYAVESPDGKGIDVRHEDGRILRRIRVSSRALNNALEVEDNLAGFNRRDGNDDKSKGSVLNKI